MEEKIDLILKYFVLQRIKDNVAFQMQVEMSERKYDKKTPPQLAPVYNNLTAEEGEILKRMAELTQFEVSQMGEEKEEDVRSDSIVQGSRDTDSNIILP
jgi:hypothetical protein